MIQNNLDPDVAERPQDLVVYGGIGKAARNWNCFFAILDCLKKLENDQTLLVQSGKPVGIIRTHENAPRVLIANSNLVPKWATWEHFHELDRKGLMMYGQMTAGSWIYIGTQGIVQGTYETFAACGRKYFAGNAPLPLSGKTVVTAGLGGMGGAQPLAAKLAGAAILCVEVDPSRVQRRLDTKYLDEVADDLDDALARLAPRRSLEDRAIHRPHRQHCRRDAAARQARLPSGRDHRPNQRPRSARRLHPARPVAGAGGPASRIGSAAVPSHVFMNRSMRMSSPCSS